MRKLIFFLLILIFAETTLASMDKVFSDWVYNENTIILDNKEFYFKLGSEGNTVLLRSDNDYNIMSLGSCKDFDEKRYICFNESFYETVTDPANKAYINIYYKKPKLNITRTINDNILLVGEQATFSVTIYNRGERNVDNVYFLDDFSDNIILKSVSGCSYKDNDVFFKGTIQRGSYKSCSYTISTTNAVDVTTIASVSYNNGFDDIINYSSAIRLYSTSVLAINSTIDNRTIQINQKTNIHINITNSATNTIEIENFIVKMPAGLNVTFAAIAQTGEGTYRWADTLYSNSSKDILFIVEGLRTGSSEILMNVDYEMDEEEYKITNYKDNVIVEDEGIELDSSIADSQRFDANTEKTISIMAINKNNYTDLKNLVLRFNSTLFSSRIYELSTLGEQAREKIGSVTLTLPDVSTTTSYKIIANITYETLYGDRGSEKLERSFIVESTKKLIITKSISPSEIEEFKEATVTVQVRNDKNVDVENVDVREIFYDNIRQLGTTSTRIEQLNKSQTVTAYEYKIIAPDVINETEYNITTIVSYIKDNEEYSFSKDSSFKVTPKKLKIVVTKSVSDTEIYNGEIINVRYTIENTDEEPAKNLVLKFADNENFDAINVYEYRISNLNPDEIITIEKEQIRPKIFGNTLVVDGSVLSYQDKNGANFNTTSTSLTLKVQETYMQGPAIFLKKKSDKYNINISEEINITINISNIGNEDANVLIVDGDRIWNKTIVAGSKEIISYKTRLYEERETSLPKVYAYYDYLGNSYRAVSNLVKVRVTSPKIRIIEEEVEQEEPEPVIEEEEEEQEIKVEKVSFFRRIWYIVLNIFR